MSTQRMFSRGLVVAVALLIACFGGVSVAFGDVWTAANSGLPDSKVTSLAIAPSSPNTLYARLKDYGVYKTTDGGANWMPVNTGLPGGVDVFSLAVDPSDPKTVYAGTEKGNGVYKTTDGGANWMPVNTGLPLQVQLFGVATYCDVRSLAIDPSTPNTVYVGIKNRGVYKTTNGGGAGRRRSKPGYRCREEVQFPILRSPHRVRVRSGSHPIVASTEPRLGGGLPGRRSTPAGMRQSSSSLPL